MLILLTWSFFYLQAQDRKDVSRNLKKLTSNSFAGRGYVNNGEAKAAQYIAKQLKKYKLETIGGSYYQSYSFGVNTFPNPISLSINQQDFTAGLDYVIGASSVSISGDYGVKYLPLSEEERKNDLSQTFLVGDKSYKEFLEANIYHAKGFIFLEEKQPIWSVYSAKDTSSYIILKVNSEKIKDSITSLQLQLESVYNPSHQSKNVWAYVEGEKYKDSIIILGAHYDHLGKMGQAIYKGANDNASGTVMVMELAKYFAKAENKPDYSIVFALFSGEEAGLLGSKYMANNFPFDLKKVKMMINLDMVAAGSDGITVVNAKTVPRVFNRLVQLNEEKKYLKEVKARGESCNSDHCPFYEKGVPAVFIYTRGPEATAYHIPEDDFESLPLTEFDDLFLLLRDVVQVHHPIKKIL